MNIETEQPGDVEAIHAVHEEAFGRPGEAILVEQIRALPEFDPRLSLVARINGQVVGHVLFSGIEILTPRGPRPALALAPLAVLPTYQRRGVASGLVLRGLGACKTLGHDIVVVLGEPGYYSRFGFERAAEYGIHAPFEVPEDAFMLLELSPAALTGVRGMVRYSKPFEGL